GASVLILGIAIAFSKPVAEPGKLRVKVTDAKTNNPLERATIKIQETKQGAFTKSDGIGVIINVQPGSYTIIASYAGYRPETQTNVTIQSGVTTELTFHLSNAAADSIVIQGRLSTGVTSDRNSGGMSIHGSKGTSNAEVITGGTAPSQGYTMGGILPKKSMAAFGGDYYAPPPPMPRDFNTAEYSQIVDNDYKDVKQEPLSTFSIDVDGGAYSNVRHFIQSGQMPPPDAVRIEEMINYFKYDYPQPKNNDPFSITTELGACPWNKNHQLALIGLQGKEIPKADAPPANLTFLLDVSGSMSPENRLPLLKRAFKLLVNELRDEDRVSIVVYAGNAGLVLSPTTGKNKTAILEALDRLEAGGSTAGGAGLKLAYATAKENFNKEFNNRVILATDGDFNIGISNTGELLRFIEEQRASGIYLTTIGVGEDNYKDARLEQLADKGNGNYYYIDNILEAKKVFVTQLGGTLNAIAKDVKLQIEFNPAYIKGYRLIGYENRVMAKEDFNNDKKDAGELGSGHTVTALYEIIPVGAADNGELHSVDSLRYQRNTPSPILNFGGREMMMVKFRYKRPADSTSLLIEHPLLAAGPSIDQPHLQLAGNLEWAASVAEFGMLLRDSKFKGTSSAKDALALARSAKGVDNEGYRAEFIKLIEAYQLLDKASK
ncbi:MAG TPA: von Willebrand factor type A domain-containing protein, partial [Candidatus Kapabacteria bacterium]|nr:von Willebrand factor type A domain-containing protein [Candidatus Kapabacteria bacterium]